MPLVLGGANHKTSPLWLRERAALSSMSLFDTRKRLLKKPGIGEVVVISTCNRVEFYAAGPDSKKAMNSLRLFLLGEYGIPAYELDRFFYFAEEDKAASHLFTVITGADSMVVGEVQIAGQVQRSFEQARAEGNLGPELDRLASAAARVAERVRKETEFSSSPVSIGSVAVEMAKNHLGSLKNRSAMILGAGEMGILTAKSLSANGIAAILVANRTLSRAQDVAHSLGGRAVDYTEMEAQVEKVDILVTSTSAPHVLIKKNMIEKVIEARPRRPLFMIDLAIPRNIDPQVSDLPGVILINVDDLQEVADGNSRERLSELDRVREIIEEETMNFMNGTGKPAMSLYNLGLG